MIHSFAPASDIITCLAIHGRKLQRKCMDMTLITMPGRLYSDTLAENKSFCTNCPNTTCYYGSVEREFIRTLFLRGTVEPPF